MPEDVPEGQPTLRGLSSLLKDCEAELRRLRAEVYGVFEIYTETDRMIGRVEAMRGRIKMVTPRRRR